MARAAWRFQPHPAPAGRDRELDQLPIRLASILRGGHGAGVAFEWVVRSGASPELTVELEDAPSTRWWSRGVVPAYPPGAWDSIPVDSRSTRTQPRWFGLPELGWPAPLRDPHDRVPLLHSVITFLGTLPPGIVVAWSLRPALLGAPRPPAPEDRTRDDHPTRPGAPRSVAPYPARQTLRPTDQLPLWESRVRAGVDATVADDVTIETVPAGLASATRSVQGNGLRFRERTWWRRERGPSFPITEGDAIATFPTGECGVGPAFRSHPASLVPVGRTRLGQTVGVPVDPNQGRHLAILGETGMGKSSLLIALARRIALGNGLIVLDPLGDTARAVRDEISDRLGDRLLWIGPSASGGMNALAALAGGSDVDEARRERRLNDLVHALRRVRGGRYADSGFWGPRLEEMLTRALYAAAALPGGTLRDAHALLAAEGRGFRQVPPEATDAVRSLADRIRNRPEDADGARRLLYEVIRSPTLVRMLCASAPTIRAEELVRPGKVVLVAGDAASVGESTARYLLAVYFALIWAELLARPENSKTWVLLDEAQWFVHESLAEMLRLGRRQNVHVVLATQAVGSLPEGVAEAAWTNVADFVVFRGAPADARDLARAVSGVTAESILALPRGEAVLLTGKGRSVARIRTARMPQTDRRVDEPEPAAALPQSEPKSPPETAAAETPDVDPNGVAEVLRAIDGMPRSSPNGLVRVSLRELRARCDPSGRSVRAAGDRLGRRGAIVATGRDENGPFWWINPHRVFPEGPPDPTEESRRGTGAAQPS
jgi:Helicase HerA, central domain